MIGAIVGAYFVIVLIFFGIAFMGWLLGLILETNEKEKSPKISNGVFNEKGQQFCSGCFRYITKSEHMGFYCAHCDLHLESLN
jgi:hypothetical protein